MPCGLTLLGAGGNSSAGGGGGGLSAHVTSGWKLEEASGSRLDVITATAMDLTDNGTVGQATGKIGNCASFVRASSQYLSHADSAALSLGGGSFSISVWVYLTTVTGVHFYTVVSKANSTSDHEYIITMRPDNSQIFTEVGYASTVFAKTWSSITQLANTWYHLAFIHNETTSQDNLYVNNVAQGPTANANGSRDGGATFYVGRTNNRNYGDADGTANLFNGRIDSLYLFKGYALTSTDVAALYNSGAGADYPSF